MFGDSAVELSGGDIAISTLFLKLGELPEYDAFGSAESIARVRQVVGIDQSPSQQIP